MRRGRSAAPRPPPRRGRAGARGRALDGAPVAPEELLGPRSGRPVVGAAAGRCASWGALVVATSTVTVVTATVVAAVVILVLVVVRVVVARERQGNRHGLTDDRRRERQPAGSGRVSVCPCDVEGDRARRDGLDGRLHRMIEFAVDLADLVLVVLLELAVLRSRRPSRRRRRALLVAGVVSASATRGCGSRSRCRLLERNSVVPMRRTTMPRIVRVCSRGRRHVAWPPRRTRRASRSTRGRRQRGRARRATRRAARRAASRRRSP